MEKEWLFGKTLGELAEVAASFGMPRFTATQIAAWIYRKGALSIDEMTNISLKNRRALEERYQVGRIPSAAVQQSADGTKKYLFPTLRDRFVESAYIPDGQRATLCVSSQSGCRMGCRFCMTARQGFAHNLTAGEILNQIRSIPESAQLTNVVYMGMGEPLDNADNVLRSLEILTADWGYAWSPTRITLSTVGVIPAMRTFLEKTKVHLAVSLHNPFAAERLEMMPVQNRYPIEEVVKELKKWDFSHQRRISFEYIMFRGINDSDRHVAALVRLLAGLKCRINLIRFHAIPDAPMQSPDETTLVRFRDALTRRGITTTIRASRGEDIQAACGLLSTREREKREAGSGQRPTGNAKYRRKCTTKRTVFPFCYGTTIANDNRYESLKTEKL